MSELVSDPRTVKVDQREEFNVLQVKDVCCGGSDRREGTEVGMVEWCLVEDPENKHWAAGNRFEEEKKNEVAWIEIFSKKK